MKQIFVYLFVIVLLSCNQSGKEGVKSETKSTEVATTTENFNWLLGNWKRLDEEAGKETFEIWEKLSSKEYVGIGFTMQNGDTIKQEKI